MKPPPGSAEYLLEHSAFLRRIARAMLHEHDADDVVQETWLRAIQSPPNDPGSVRSWLSVVARRIAWRSATRAASRRNRETRVARPLITPGVAETAERLEQERAVVDAVQRLREPYRTTLVLRYFDGLAPREIAARENTPIETVRSRIQRGLRELRQDLGPDSRCALAIACIAAGPNKIAPISGALLMTATQKIGALVLATGAVVGVTVLATDATESAPVRRDTEVAELKQEVAMLKGQLRDERTRNAAIASAVIPEESEKAREPGGETAVRTVVSKVIGKDPRADVRLARIAREMEGAWDAADGDQVLELLRELAEELPYSRQLLMKMLVGLEGHYQNVGISGVSWEAILAHQPIRELLVWALGNDGPAAFRELAAWTLPWQQDTKDTVALFRRVLEKEQESDVARALLRGLAELNTAGARETIRETLANQTHSERIRILAAASLGTDRSEESVRILTATSKNDPSEVVRRAASVAFAARSAPVAGYLVVGVRPRSLAHEITVYPGDILTRYDGESLAGTDRQSKLHHVFKKRLRKKGILILELHREGKTVKLPTRAGWLGVDGLHVQATDVDRTGPK